jgi:hypothetical protein
MLVYGDAEAQEQPTEKLARLRGFLAESEAAPAGIERHGLVVAALIEAGELAQGIADHAFEAAGRVDGPSPVAEAAMALTVALAGEVARSWDSLPPLPCHGRARPGHPDRKGATAAEVGPAEGSPAGGREEARDGRDEPGHDKKGVVRAALQALASRPDLPAAITVKQPEGFAHYAVYPEAYLAAGRALPDETSRVIGIRSIGTTLAAMLAAARDLPVPASLRPVGHPYRRELAVQPDLAATLADPDGSFAVADEGPGFSGSSFASVALWLERRGVPLDRIHFVPSHGGEPGGQADPELRRVWAAVPRQLRTFDDVVLGAATPGHRLENWVADLVGTPQGGLVDISGGGWRRHRPGLEAVPVLDWQEKRKFLLTSDSGAWLLKFTGLGRVGFAKRDRALALAEAGFTPPIAGWRHGFLVERWLGDATPLAGRGPEAQRSRVDHLGAYLGFRARHFPAPGRGASAERLFEMARHNIGEGLGEDAAGRLEPWRPLLAVLERHRRPVETDNRLQAWEWLSHEGRIFKTDALDHHSGHDLVGPQDIAWDIAGATIEFALDDGEQAALAEAVARDSGIAVDAEWVRFALPCYAAFQLGYYSMAASGTGNVAERSRLEAAASRYRAALDRLLPPL